MYIYIYIQCSLAAVYGSTSWPTMINGNHGNRKSPKGDFKWRVFHWHVWLPEDFFLLTKKMLVFSRCWFQEIPIVDNAISIYCSKVETCQHHDVFTGRFPLDSPSVLLCEMYLVGGDWYHGMDYDFPYIGNFMIPTDFHIFQRGWNHQPGMFGGTILSIYSV